MSQDNTDKPKMSPQRIVAWRMHAFTNLVQSSYYQRTEKPLGVALPEWRVLRAALFQPGASQGEVAAGEGLNVMIVSRAVSGLRRKGLIEVQPDPKDRRRKQLVPTEMGKAFAQDMAAREQTMYSHVYSVLSTDELATLDDLLGRVNDHVRTNQLPEVPPPSRQWRDVIDAHSDTAGTGNTARADNTANSDEA